MTGIKRKIFFIQDPEEMANLFLDLLTGLRLLVIRKKQLFYLEQEEYQILLDKSEAFTEIFIRGLITDQNKSLKKSTPNRRK